jgi:hypothetical protein
MLIGQPTDRPGDDERSANDRDVQRGGQGDRRPAYHREWP